MPYGVNPLQSYQVYDADIFAIDGMEVRRIVFPRQKVHFHEVVKVAAKTVTLIPIERKVQLKGFMRYTAMPIQGSGKGKAFRRRIIDCFDVPACRITSYATARLWDGKAREGSSYA